MERRPIYPQLKSARARALLEEPEPGFAKRHPLISRLAVAGAVAVTAILIYRGVKDEERPDSDSARVAVAAKENGKMDQRMQLARIIMARKALEGKISWAKEDNSILTNEDLREELKGELFAMGREELDGYRDRLKAEIKGLSEKMGMLSDAWANWTDADAKLSEILSARKKEAEERLELANQESWKRHGEGQAIESYEWRSMTELESLRDLFRRRIGMDEWSNERDRDYLQRNVLVLNWAISERERGETGLSLSREALSMRRAAFVE